MGQRKGMFQRALPGTGVSHIKKLGFGLMEGVIWDELSANRRARIEAKTRAFAAKFQNLKHRVLFVVCKILHKSILKQESTPGADNQFWIDHGWL
jgi:hypothetical protein